MGNSTVIRQFGTPLERAQLRSLLSTKGPIPLARSEDSGRPLRILQKSSQSRCIDLRFVLDALDVSIILVGFDSRIVWFSTAAERLIEETTELQMHGGLLLLNGNTITHHWLASTEKVRRWSAQLLIRNSGKPLPLLIQETALLDDQRPGFVLQLADFDMPGTSRSAVLQSLYGLTHSEARFADAFVTQCDIKKTAEKLGISEQAARFTIKAIFRKTGTCKQAQFVKLLFSLPGL